MTLHHTNKLIENQIVSNSRITTIEGNNNWSDFNDVNRNLNIFTEPEKLESQSKHINCRDGKFYIGFLAKLRKDYKSNAVIEWYSS